MTYLHTPSNTLQNALYKACIFSSISLLLMMLQAVIARCRALQVILYVTCKKCIQCILYI